MNEGLITHIDPSICSLNLGDYIISDAVTTMLRELLPNSQIAQIQSQDSWFRGAYRVLKNSKFSFVGGTNLLCSNMPFYRQWKLSPLDIYFKNEIVLLGVGWWQYQSNVNFYTKWLYRNILSSQYIHSVRDDYTKEKLESIGITNVINTGCMTMWGLTKEHCNKIPKEKAESVVITITDYRPSENDDQDMIDMLLSKYKNVYIWPQGHLDLSYINKIWKTNWENRVEIVGRSLSAFDSLLMSKADLDYVGTRLHGGIRALQFKRRCIIIEVDNRAKEKAKKFGLVTVERGNLEQLENLIINDFETNINLPVSDIEAWKQQFKK